MRKPFVIKAIIDVIVDKSKELQNIYEQTYFYPEDLEEIAEELSGDIDVLIGELEEL